MLRNYYLYYLSGSKFRFLKNEGLVPHYRHTSLNEYLNLPKFWSESLQNCSRCAWDDYSDLNRPRTIIKPRERIMIFFLTFSSGYGKKIKTLFRRSSSSFGHFKYFTLSLDEFWIRFVKIRNSIKNSESKFLIWGRIWTICWSSIKFDGQIKP